MNKALPLRFSVIGLLKIGFLIVLVIGWASSSFRFQDFPVNGKLGNYGHGFHKYRFTNGIHQICFWNSTCSYHNKKIEDFPELAILCGEPFPITKTEFLNLKTELVAFYESGEYRLYGSGWRTETGEEFEHYSFRNESKWEEDVDKVFAASGKKEMVPIAYLEDRLVSGILIVDGKMQAGLGCDEKITSY